MDDVVDAEEYLLPYKGRGNQERRPCSAVVQTHLTTLRGGNSDLI